MEDKAMQAPETKNMGPEIYEKRDCTTLWWLTGGGFMINSRGTILLVDPIISYNGSNENECETGTVMLARLPIQAKDLGYADGVFYTHSDGDHCGSITASELSNRIHVKSFGPPPVYERLIQMGISWKEVQMCRAGDCIQISDIEIYPVPADHPHQFYDRYLTGKAEKVFRPGDCVGYIIKTMDGTIFFPGDTRLMEYHLFLKDLVDVLILDVSFCHYHLSPEGAIVLANELDHAYLLPCHYGTYQDEKIPGYYGNPKNVLEKVRNGEKRGRILAPGEAFSIRDGKECERRLLK